MKRGLFAIAVLAVVFATLAGLAAARTMTGVSMTARLKATKLQAAKTPNASGQFTGTLLRLSNGRSKLTWKLTYKNLGTRAREADVVGPVTKNHPTPFYVLLCRPCTASAHGVVNPILKRSTTALLRRTVYVVIYAKKNTAKFALRGRVARIG